MPLKGEAKRRYDRLWRQRKRSQGTTLGGRGVKRVKRGVGGEGVVPIVNVVPDVVPTKSKQPPVSQWSFATLVYTLRRRVTLLEREQLALEQAYIQHQAEHIVHETPRVYADYLEEEGEEP